MRRSCWLPFILLAVVAVGGCQSDETAAESIGKTLSAPLRLFQSEPKTAPSVVLLEAENAYRLGYTPRWSANLGLNPRDDSVAHAAVLGDLLVCVERPSNMVSAVSVRDGTIRWQTLAAGRTEQIFQPVRRDDTILINSETMMYTFSAENGHLIGDSKLESAVLDGPALVNDLAIFGGLSGRLFAHSAVTGYSKWAYQMTGGIVVRPIASGYNVFVADSNGVYALLQSDAGDVIWKGRAFGRISALPAISGHGVYIASEDQTLYALNRNTGADRWKYRSAVPLRNSPVLIDNTVFLNDPSVGLVALDAATGAQRWRLDIPATPIVIDNKKLLLHHDTRLLLVDPDSGKTIVQVSTRPLKSILTGPDQSLLLISESGNLMRLDPQK